MARYHVIDGPSKFDLMACLFDNDWTAPAVTMKIDRDFTDVPEEIRKKVRRTHFVIKDEENRKRNVVVLLDSLQRLNRAWRFTAYTFQKELPIAKVNGVYKVIGRDGWLETELDLFA